MSRNEKYTAYDMGYFTETPQGRCNELCLHLAYSRDALNWIPLHGNRPVLIPSIGEKGMRDSYVYRKQDGAFVVLATNMWNSESIMCYESPDLATFTEGRLLRLNTAGMHAWAPEVIYDADRGDYAILWSGNTDHNRIYVNYTTDFIQESVTGEVQGCMSLFYRPGFQCGIGFDGKDIFAFRDTYISERIPFTGDKATLRIVNDHHELVLYFLNLYESPGNEVPSSFNR